MFNAEFRILEARMHCITTLRTGLAAGTSGPMPVNSCFSNRGGTNWSGFTNDAVFSFRISGGCCRFYRDADCQGGPMFTECNVNVPSIHDKYGQFNDQLSSIFCY
ncbi:uncharacterized protein VDAG_03615 [Verticillium dahliae VdLs.17]|uniref:Uncharacterized protein n=1 Tax=Verticillium dahliae (strain VdLs.17 / ATCC MYA-4575 / FGSC 10137) TaxID=498257 RepID=G2X1K4_VERDV|nr:uncharacterized protein VDAG_03615 [Verticillium dahliae VdLs.17]EGY22177.1 hypothetical protein VDAG_03615 [Verticillium dahliae VdLs.17]